MKQETRIIMGMPVKVAIVGKNIPDNALEPIFEYFVEIDNRFSTYKEDSEASMVGRGEILAENYSPEMQEVMELAEITKNETDGYFDVYLKDKFDPSGIVKGWAIFNASKILLNNGYDNFFIDAGGDIQTHGYNMNGEKWSIGIKDPWNQQNIVKTVYLSGEGIATSGTYIRGKHIYNPITNKTVDDIASITVIASNVYDADRMATAAFVMGEKGIEFVEQLDGYEGYMITKEKTATMSTNFKKYLINK